LNATPDCLAGRNANGSELRKSFFTRASVALSKHYSLVFEPARGEVVSHVLQLVSFPKSGRTWLRVMLDDLRIGNTYTHDGAGYEDNSSIHDIDPDKTRYAVGPVLLIVRDPRDIVVSGYFQAVRRLRLKEVHSMSHFVRDERYGIEKVVQFNLQWFAAARQVPRFALVSYESLHENTVRVLSAIVEFAGYERPHQFVQSVVLRRSFVKMRRVEASGGFRTRYGSALTPADPYDPESYKVRRGKIGGYIDYLSDVDVAYCNRILEEADYWSGLQQVISRYGVRLLSAERAAI
jgi:hypothetical protein